MANGDIIECAVDSVNFSKMDRDEVDFCRQCTRPYDMLLFVGDSTLQECCHCCNVGIIAYEARLPCSLMAQFRPDCDAAFRECCENGRIPPAVTSSPAPFNTPPLHGPPTTTVTQTPALEGYLPTYRAAWNRYNVYQLVDISHPFTESIITGSDGHEKHT